jgi:hypothetical protein
LHKICSRRLGLKLRPVSTDCSAQEDSRRSEHFRGGSAGRVSKAKKLHDTACEEGARVSSAHRHRCNFHVSKDFNSTSSVLTGSEAGKSNLAQKTSNSCSTTKRNICQVSAQKLSSSTLWLAASLSIGWSSMVGVTRDLRASAAR